MSWTYSNWITQSTAALRLSVLRQHVQEVADAFGPSVTGADMGVDRSELRQYLADLQAQVAVLEASPAARINGGVSYARVRDAT